ncbi:MAG: hypothetical protein WC365_06075 [Candidatus Babeliales bacterium]|jgi:hypothetical protein
MVNKSAITLLSLCKSIKIEDLQSQFPASTIYACDFYIEGIEKETSIIGGFRSKTIINIDHHAPIEDMANFTTSTSLAVAYVQSYGSARNDEKIVINHTDCDSILSSLVIAGILQPKEEYKYAALCADHTGEISEISEILQALEKERDLELSSQALLYFVSTGKIAQNVMPYISAYKACRERVRDFISNAYYVDDIAVVQIDNKIQSLMLLPYFPQAKIIMAISPHSLYPEKTAISIIRGPMAPKNLYINTLPLPQEFGGRWNMGSNKRSGGTSFPIDSYIKIIQEALKRF